MVKPAGHSKTYSRSRAFSRHSEQLPGPADDNVIARQLEGARAFVDALCLALFQRHPASRGEGTVSVEDRIVMHLGARVGRVTGAIVRRVLPRPKEHNLVAVKFVRVPRQRSTDPHALPDIPVQVVMVMVVVTCCGRV